MTAYRKPSKPEPKPRGWPHEHVPAGPHRHPEDPEDDETIWLRRSERREAIADVAHTGIWLFFAVIIVVVAVLVIRHAQDRCYERGGRVAWVYASSGWVCVEGAP